MKPREWFGPDDPRVWLNRARTSLARARHRVPGTYLEDTCFDAQQAAEKAIMAVMVLRSIDFPYIRELARLKDILKSKGEVIPRAQATVREGLPDCGGLPARGR